MIFGRLFRTWAGRPQLLTVDLDADDRMALGTIFSNLSEEECAALDWSIHQRQKLFEALMAYSPKGYDAWRAGEETLVPVTLPMADWKMVERLCSELVTAAPYSWSLRVLMVIRAKIM